MYKRKSARFLLLAGILMFGSGCNSALLKTIQTSEEAVKVEAAAEGSMDYLAAVNLINTLVQVPRLHPEAAGDMLMSQPDSEFGRHVSEIMKIAGYDISYAEDSGHWPLFISYEQKVKANETTYQINVEDFKVRRAYALVDKQVMPRTSMFVYGVEPASIKSNDAIFQQYLAFPAVP